MKAEITLLTSMYRAINTEICKNTLLKAFVLEAKMCVATNQNEQILQNQDTQILFSFFMLFHILPNVVY